MKRKINILLHNIRELTRNKKLKLRFRFLVFSLIVLFIVSVGVFAVIKTFAFYNSNVSLSLDIQTAIYVVEPGEMSFNIDLEKVIPSDEPYIYTFSVSNFNEERRTDVDLEYDLEIITTTNLPLEYKLYYNAYDLSTNDIITTRDIRQDEDNSFYNYFKVDQKYSFTFKENQTHIYYLIINFPTTYKDVIEYSDAIDNIQVKINTQQVL